MVISKSGKGVIDVFRGEGGGDLTLNKVVRECLIQEVTYMYRNEEDEGASYAGIWGKCIQVEGKSKCKVLR